MNMELYHRIKFASVNIRKFFGFDGRERRIALKTLGEEPLKPLFHSNGT